ncbi:hypothetical protein OE88DRAFT_1631465 [Heliocybe sulcata]|uniref:Uncharacterized protein n=1 Tax=Heliocybe sulcata TaxID=5364 RepID=A0A5C3MYV9_9AGAM|nr:hypothetical protein OE88DRAFT_1631465 [Heliocybe sulcata]
MKFFAAAAISSLVALASAAPALQCYEALRFGVISVSPTTLAAGDTATITADFTCAVEYYNHVPKYTDYLLEVPQNNNGYEAPYLLAHREPAPGTLTDQFTVQASDSLCAIPHAYYWNASYDIFLQMTYPQNGTDGSTYYTVGGVYAPVTITTVNA